MNDIEHEIDGAKGGFIIEQDDEIIAEMTYSRDDDKMIIDRTWVDDSLRGQGIARKLLDQAIELARDDKLKVVPRCSYVRAQMQQHEELRDVLDPTFVL